MNLDLRIITNFPLKIVGLDHDRALHNAEPDRQRLHREQVAQPHRYYGVAAHQHRANVGEGRPL